MPFENLLAAIADEGERASFKTIADKYPAVKRYVELGEEVEPLLPRLRSLQYDRVFPAVEELEGWRNWKEKDWPGWKRSTTGFRMRSEVPHCVCRSLKSAEIPT